MKFGGLFKDQFAKCLLCLGVNGASTFQGLDMELLL
jgi:hypothetical protein